MPIRFKLIDDRLEPLILKMKIQVKLTELDYEVLVPEIERLTERGIIRIHCELYEFNGWTLGAIWEDTKFSGMNFGNVERIAIVGDKYWARGMTNFTKAFKGTVTRFYDSSNIEDANQWIMENRGINFKIEHHPKNHQ